MGSRSKKKRRISSVEIGEEDRISRLPDELIHKIYSFLDAKEAVQSSALSKRWEHVWTNLPFLNFGRYENSSPKNVSKFIRHVLSHRNHQSNVLELKFCVRNKGFSKGLVDKFIKYAFHRNLQCLSLELLDDHEPFKLSTFSSQSLEKLTLRVNLEECTLESDYWDLPILATLHLWHPRYSEKHGFLDSWLKDSWFTCLPALKTLCLYDWDYPSFSFRLPFPAIRTLHLFKCNIPMKTVWNFPALTTIQLDDVYLPENMNMSDIFSALVNLQNLTLYLTSNQKYYSISCPPQLLNLTIRTIFRYYDFGWKNIAVSAPKLCNFTSFGIFAAIIGVPELENLI
ncbi:F-box/FBD/LRR-repeat protein At1g51370-like [Apium graveolens]|uniref:F-box/FBD/LRR-repeat protein At1g51370-like n=1 Tax=Apium graveolens TaxID=4045 RepID=UPI003D793468